MAITLGSSLSLPVLAAGLRWLRFILGCPPSVASLWRGLIWFFLRYWLACPHGAAVPLDSWVWWCSYSSCWVTSLRSGRCSSFTLDSSSLAWLRGEPSTVFLLLCLPSGCGHPLGSLVSFVTIDRQRRLPLEGFFLCVVASHFVVLSWFPYVLCQFVMAPRVW